MLGRWKSVALVAAAFILILACGSITGIAAVAGQQGVAETPAGGAGEPVTSVTEGRVSIRHTDSVPPAAADHSPADAGRESVDASIVTPHGAVPVTTDQLTQAGLADGDEVMATVSGPGAVTQTTGDLSAFRVTNLSAAADGSEEYTPPDGPEVPVTTPRKIIVAPVYDPEDTRTMPSRDQIDLGTVAAEGAADFWPKATNGAVNIVSVETWQPTPIQGFPKCAGSSATAFSPGSASAQLNYGHETPTVVFFVYQPPPECRGTGEGLGTAFEEAGHVALRVSDPDIGDLEMAWVRDSTGPHEFGHVLGLGHANAVSLADFDLPCDGSWGGQCHWSEYSDTKVVMGSGSRPVALPPIAMLDYLGVQTKYEVAPLGTSEWDIGPTADFDGGLQAVKVPYIRDGWVGSLWVENRQPVGVDAALGSDCSKYCGVEVRYTAGGASTALLDYNATANRYNPNIVIPAGSSMTLLDGSVTVRVISDGMTAHVVIERNNTKPAFLTQPRGVAYQLPGPLDDSPFAAWAGADEEDAPCKMTATAEGTPDPSITWQTSSDQQTWSEVGTGTSYECSPDRTHASTTYYRAVATNSEGSVVSKTTMVRVFEQPTAALTPAATCHLAGDKVTLAVTDPNQPPLSPAGPDAYGSQVGALKASDVSANPTEFPGITLKGPGQRFAAKYYVIDDNGAYLGAAWTLVAPCIGAEADLPTIAIQPESVNDVTPGDEVRLSLEAAGAQPLRFAWQYSDNGTGWNDIDDSNSPALTVGSDLTPGTSRHYRCLVSNDYGSTTSSIATVTTSEAPSETPSPSPSPTETTGPGPSPSASETATPSPWASPSETASPTPSPTPSVSPSQTPGPSPSPSGSASPVFDWAKVTVAKVNLASGPVQVGDPIGYRVTVINQNSADAMVSISDVLPEGTRLAAGQVAWDVSGGVGQSVPFVATANSQTSIDVELDTSQALPGSPVNIVALDQRATTATCRQAPASPGCAQDNDPPAIVAATPSPVPTATPSEKPTPSETATPSPTPTTTPAQTPSPSPSATPTQSAEPSASPSSTPGPSPSATATSSPGVTPSESPSPSPTGSPSPDVTPVADVEMTVSYSPDRVTAAGQVVTYTVTAVNKGGAPGVVPAPLLAGVPDAAWSCDTPLAGPLVAGAKRTCTYSHTVTRQEFESGSVPGGVPVAQPVPDPPLQPDDVWVSVSNDAPGALKQVRPGDTYTYSFTAHSSVDWPISGSLRVLLPPGVIADPAGQDGWSRQDGQLIYGGVGTIEPGGSASATLKVTVTGQAAGVLNVRASVSQAESICYSGDMISLNCGQDYRPPTVLAFPDVTITKASSLAVGQKVSVGDLVTYTLTVTNHGASDATGVKVEDQMPLGFSFPAGRNPGWKVTDGVDGVVTFYPSASRTIDVPAGQPVTVTLIAVAEQATTTPVANTAVVAPTSLWYCSQAGSGTGCATDQAPFTVDASNIKLTKQAQVPASGRVGPGQDFTYLFTVANTGSQDATEQVTDLLPDTIEAFPPVQDGWQIQGQHVTSALVTVPAGGQPAEVVLKVRVKAGALRGATISNTASLQARTPLAACAQDPSLPGCAADDVRPVVDDAALTLTKTNTLPDGAIIGQGQTYRYDLTVTNDGGVTSAPITITDQLPAGVTLAPATQPDWASNHDGLLTSRPVTVPPGTAVILHAEVEVTAQATPGPVVNTAAMSPATLAQCATNPATTGCASDQHPPTYAPATIALAMTPSVPAGSAVRPGQVFDYQLTATNTGKTTARAIQITTLLPAGLELAEGPDAWTPDGPRLRSATFDLAPDAATSVTLRVKVAAGADDGRRLITTASTTPMTPVDQCGSAVLPGCVTDAPGMLVDARAMAITLAPAIPAPAAGWPAGSTIPFQVTVTNTGLLDARDATITLHLPPAFQLAASPGAPWHSAGQEATITGLTAGTGESVTIPVNLTSPGPTGTHLLTAALTGFTTATTTAQATTLAATGPTARGVPLATCLAQPETPGCARHSIVIAAGPSPSPTISPTPTGKPSSTPSPTLPPTPAASPTSTPTASQTATPVPSSTPDATTSATPSAPPAATPSPSVTTNPSPGVTTNPSLGPSSTSTPSPAPTATSAPAPAGGSPTTPAADRSAPGTNGNAGGRLVSAGQHDQGGRNQAGAPTATDAARNPATGGRSLPFTGAEVFATLLAAALLTGLGLVLVRKRRSGSTK